MCDFPEVEIPRTLSLQKSCTYTAFLYVEAFVKLPSGYVKTGRYLNVVRLFQLVVKIIIGQYFPVCILVGFIVLVWLYLLLFLLIMQYHSELLVLPFCMYCNEFPPVLN